MIVARENREEGKIFEELFFKQAQRNGLLVMPNYLTCRYTYNGRTQILPGGLDFTLIKNGVVGFFDCKSFADDHFTFSTLSEHQVKRAVLYNDNRVPAGFVVWFRKIDLVVFFSGHAIECKGPGTRFYTEDGQTLGRFDNFDLKPILEVVTG